VRTRVGMLSIVVALGGTGNAGDVDGDAARTLARILSGVTHVATADEKAMLNALAFRILGTELMSLRLAFFGAWLLWIPTVWWVARRLAGPALAATTTFLAAAISLPVYPEGMPSWYNLFFATAGAAGPS